MTETAVDLRYPIGKFVAPGELTPAERSERIDRIADAPGRLAAAVAGLSPAQLDTPYRDGGWSVRQVVHHLADSHLNAYCRVRLALTEEKPTIRPYDENLWATLPDASSAEPELSLPLLAALHARWVRLLGAMTADQFRRRLVHPEHGREFTVDDIVAMYAWHGLHHVAHVTGLRERNGW